MTIELELKPIEQSVSVKTEAAPAQKPKDKPNVPDNRDR